MIKKNYSVLVVDIDQADAKSLAKTLSSQGHRALTARDGAHAMSILEYRAFEILIVDELTCRVDGVDLIDWARCLCPTPRIVATCDELSPEMDREIRDKGASLILEKPVDPARLTDYLESACSRSSFSGTLEGVDLIEYIQFVMLGGRNTVLEVTSSLGTRGLIFLSRGNVVHSICGVLEGEPALYRCLCFKEGKFSHLPWQEPDKPTINKPGEFILMEAVRKRDEVWCNDSDDKDAAL
jgi:CheY-like chemotaxis protein